MKNVPRVLFVIPGAAMGHSMVFARRQAEALIQQRIRVEVFHLRSRTSWRVLIREFRRFRQVIRTIRPQIVHAQYGTATAMFAALGAGRIPLVITYRGSDLNRSRSGSGPREFTGRILSQLAALRAARIVCVSRRLKHLLWWRQARTVVLPSGVDADLFRPRPRSTLREGLGWAEQDRVVLFNTGRDPLNKRLDLAQDAVQEARQCTPSIRLEVLDGSVDPSCVPAMMNAADCLLVTSDLEGSPAIVQEGLATNLPVIGVDVGDIAERLEGVEFSYVTERDPRALGHALAEVLNPPRRSNGRRKVGEFSCTAIARKLGKLYGEILRERSR